MKDYYTKSIKALQLKTIEAITSCRTQAQGFTVYECDKCCKLHHIYSGCGNLHCPAICSPVYKNSSKTGIHSFI